MGGLRNGKEIMYGPRSRKKREGNLKEWMETVEAGSGGKEGGGEN